MSEKQKDSDKYLALALMCVPVLALLGLVGLLFIAGMSPKHAAMLAGVLLFFGPVLYFLVRSFLSMIETEIVAARYDRAERRNLILVNPRTGEERPLKQ